MAIIPCVGRSVPIPVFMHVASFLTFDLKTTVRRIGFEDGKIFGQLGDFD